MKVFLLSVPYDSGYHKKRMGGGPQVLQSSLGKKLLASGHEVRTAEVEIDNNFPTEVTATFQVCRQISRHVAEAVAAKELPIILAGNCSSAIGTLAALSNDASVVWFDSHGDFNTPETSIGGFLDGMSLSIVTGHCWRQLSASVQGFSPISEDRVVLVGARDLDDLEVRRLSESSIRIVTPAMLRDDVAAVESNLGEPSAIYMHVDLDVLDTSFVKVNSYSTEGGLKPDELLQTISRIASRYRVAALALTAYDPGFDENGKVPELAEQILDIVTA